MPLLFVIALVAGALALAPVLVRLLGRLAGWPIAAVFLIAAGILGKEAGAVFHGRPVTYSVTWIPGFLSGSDAGMGGGSALGTDLEFALRADALSIMFALLALVIGAVVFIYSAAYLHHPKGNQSFYIIMTAFMLSVLMLVLADDVFLLFLSWELVSIASFLLIARAGSGGEAGSQRTLILTFIGGLTLLAALAISATQAGTTRLSAILAAPFWAEKPGLTVALALLVAASGFTKAAQLPFHFWLPEAMAAATPVSAFLHAAAVVKAGVYLLMRFSAVFHGVAAWNLTLIVVGMSTAVMSALYAVQKTDLKKLTAYSTVSHLGWIVATIGVGTPFALAAAAVHTLAHALFKSSLFMLIGVVDHQAGSRDVRRLGPIYGQMPFTFAATVVGALSMAAVPPLFGFVSKEGMLEAFLEAPVGNAWVVVLLVAAGVGAFLTFCYSTRLVFGAFIDGPRDLPRVHEAPVALWLPAALPGVASLPVAFLVGSLDEPVTALTDAIGEPAHVHLGLWHGITVPLLISLAVLVAGCAAIVARKRIWRRIDGRSFLPFDGNGLLARLTRGLTTYGRWAGKMAASLSPTRHLVYPFMLILALAAVTAANPGVDGVVLRPRVPGIDQAFDLIPLAIVAVSVFGLVRAKSRLNAVILISTAGVGVTLQILVLGAPDVALTQFLVEVLTAVVILLVLRQQPSTFHRTLRRRRAIAGVIALGMGVASGMGTYVLYGRHERPEIAMWYLHKAPEIAGGPNIVNTILVEFRALDTMGELSVLGMAGVVIAAVVGSVPRHPFQEGTHPAPLGESQLNSVPMRQLSKLLLPILALLSLLIFMRGHTVPGGGFIAALVAGAIFMVMYLNKGKDLPVVARKAPMYLTGVGMLMAVGTGFLGLTQGSFLYAIHGELLGQHLTTSMIFDGGIYLAVLGMVTQAINSMGGYLRPGADEALLPFTRDEAHPLTTWSAPEVRDSDEPAYPDSRGGRVHHNRARIVAAGPVGVPGSKTPTGIIPDDPGWRVQKSEHQEEGANR